MVDKPQAPIDIRFGQLGVLQLRFRTLDPGVILDELRGRFSSAPQFFRRAAVCIDLLTVKPFPDVDALRAIMDAVSRTGMIPIGLAGEATAVEPLAIAVKPAGIIDPSHKYAPGSGVGTGPARARTSDRGRSCEPGTAGNRHYRDARQHGAVAHADGAVGPASVCATSRSHRERRLSRRAPK